MTRGKGRVVATPSAARHRLPLQLLVVGVGGKVAFIAVNSQELKQGAGLALARRHKLAEAVITLARDVGPPPAKLLHDNLGRGMPLNAFYDSEGNLLDTGRGALLEGKLPAVLKRFYGVDLEL